MRQPTSFGTRPAARRLLLFSCGALVGCGLGYQRPDDPDPFGKPTESMAQTDDGDDDDDDDDDDDTGAGDDDGDTTGAPGDDDDDDDTETGDDDDDDDDMPRPMGAMSFFVTSVGNGSGNFGGIDGADAFCNSLAIRAGAPGVWRAYLSTAPIEGVGGDLVHARNRIGLGPWFNADGQLIAESVDQLHANGLDTTLVLDEQGNPIPSDEHDIVTGSTPDGFALTDFPDNPAAPAPTCFNWSASDVNAWVWVGHMDADPGDSWNSTHATSCDPPGLASTAGSARLYCFAE